MILCYKASHYKDHPSLRFHECVYCGGWGDVRDHIPAKVHGAYGVSGDYIIVRSCSRCNSIAGVRAWHTFKRRRRKIRQRIGKLALRRPNFAKYKGSRRVF